MKTSRKKNISPKNSDIKAKSPNEILQQEQIATETVEIKKQNILKNIIILFVSIFLIFILVKIIDDYTGWGNIERVIKKNLDNADRYAIYKKYNSAIKIYEKILKRWGSDSKYLDYIKQAKLNLAKTYKDANENIQAIKIFNELLEEYKNINKDMYAWILLEIGDTYNNMYNTQDAIKTYQMILDEFKGTDWEAEAIFGLAESNKIAGKTDIAIKYYQKIVKKYKNGFLSAEALTNIAQIYERQGNEKDALKIYNKIINEFPEIVTEYARLRYNSLNEKLKDTH